MDYICCGDIEVAIYDGINFVSDVVGILWLVLLHTNNMEKESAH